MKDTDVRQNLAQFREKSSINAGFYINIPCEGSFKMQQSRQLFESNNLIKKDYRNTQAHKNGLYQV